jgi:hypothetical protein
MLSGAADELDECCVGARRLLQELNNGAEIAEASTDPDALIEVLRILVETTSRTLPKGWMLPSTGT